MGQEASLVESKSKVLELECEYIIEKQIFFWGLFLWITSIPNI